MSWSPEVFIGEMRPWPDSVRVVRGRTGEMVRYMPERTCTALLRDGLELPPGFGDAWRECSKCGTVLVCGHDLSALPNFCPDCGARVVDE